MQGLCEHYRRADGQVKEHFLITSQNKATLQRKQISKVT